MDELERGITSGDSRDLLGLPETEMELDNLTEFNTAHNRRITMLGIAPDADKLKGKKRKIRVRNQSQFQIQEVTLSPFQITFNEDEEVINPEDIDPSVGRFRNMIETTIIPKKVRRRKFFKQVKFATKYPF